MSLSLENSYPNMLFFFADPAPFAPASVVTATADGADAGAMLVSRDPPARFRHVSRVHRVLPRLIWLSVTSIYPTALARVLRAEVLNQGAS
ncbi:hypothetical protein EKD04_020830 [Chloroflexales bacterium ZM16-3]|nr:hypothetical protein [Chloroflexales bacterium ZM16-3]